MPITKSAKKALRQNIKHRKVNEANKVEFKRAVKKFKALLVKDKKEAEKNLADLYQRIDKSAKNKIISKNRASRLKSRLTKKLAIK